MKPSERIREIAEARVKQAHANGWGDFERMPSVPDVLRYLDEQDEAASAQLSRMVAELKSKPSGGGNP